MSVLEPSASVFFRGERSHRSPRSFIITGFAAFFALLVTNLAWAASNVRDRIIFGSIAVVVLSLTGQKIFRVVTGKVDRYQIDEQGIRINGTLKRWAQIGYIGAIGLDGSDTVRLCYSRTRYTSWRFLVRELPDDRPISREAYELLMAKLKHLLQHRHPQLRIGELLEPGGD